MSHGFDLNSPLVCEGIIGDGCGGGRIFSITNKKLVAYDPQTQESITLLEDIENAVSISKKACIITLTCRGQIVKFDLSLMSVIPNDT